MNKSANKMDIMLPFVYNYDIIIFKRTRKLT